MVKKMWYKYAVSRPYKEIELLRNKAYGTQSRTLTPPFRNHSLLSTLRSHLQSKMERWDADLQCTFLYSFASLEYTLTRRLALIRSSLNTSPHGPLHPRSLPIHSSIRSSSPPSISSSDQGPPPSVARRREPSWRSC